jgi:exosortase/archaeosortase
MFVFLHGCFFGSIFCSWDSFTLQCTIQINLFLLISSMYGMNLTLLLYPVYCLCMYMLFLLVC